MHPSGTEVDSNNFQCLLTKTAEIDTNCFSYTFLWRHIRFVWKMVINPGPSSSFSHSVLDIQTKWQNPPLWHASQVPAKFHKWYIPGARVLKQCPTGVWGQRSWVTHVQTLAADLWCILYYTHFTHIHQMCLISAVPLAQICTENILFTTTNKNSGFFHVNHTALVLETSTWINV